MIPLVTCRCAHFEHEHPAARCTVALPAWPELELPAWSCPCRSFVPAGRRVAPPMLRPGPA